MRTESDVLSQISSWADVWDNIRMVILTGSRAGSGQTADALSDYDLDVSVRDTRPIVRDESWLHPFGPIMVRWPLRPQWTFDQRWITQLVLFDDDVRIDFQFTSIPEPELSHGANEYRVLVDKDGISEELPRPSVAGVPPSKPSPEEFADRLNAFWWDIPYVAKALRRSEFNYARYMLDGTLRFDKLLPLLRWYVNVLHGRSIDTGMFGRWIHRSIDEPTWAHYLRTFGGASVEDGWRAMFEMVDLVRSVGTGLADSYGYEYPFEVDTNVSSHLRRVQQMDLSENDPSPSG